MIDYCCKLCLLFLKVQEQYSSKVKESSLTHLKIALKQFLKSKIIVEFVYDSSTKSHTLKDPIIIQCNNETNEQINNSSELQAYD